MALVAVASSSSSSSDASPLLLPGQPGSGGGSHGGCFVRQESDRCLFSSCLCCEGCDAELGGHDAVLLRRRLRAPVAQGCTAQVAQCRRRLRRLQLQRRGRARPPRLCAKFEKLKPHGDTLSVQTKRSLIFIVSIIPSILWCTRNVFLPFCFLA